MKKTIDQMDPDCRLAVSVIVDIAAEVYGLNPAIVTSQIRNSEPLKARYSCYAFLVSLKKHYSMADIGAPFERDHASVISGLTQHMNFYETDKQYRQKFDQISLKARAALAGKSQNQTHDLIQRIDRTIEGLEEIKKMLLNLYFDGTQIPDSVRDIIHESFPEHDEKRTIEKTIADGIQIG